MRGKIFTTLLLSLFYSISFADTWGINNNTMPTIVESRFIRLEENIKSNKLELEKTINTDYKQAIDSATWIVANWLSTQTTILSIFTILIWLISIVLSWHIHSILSEISSKNQETKDNLKIIEWIKEELECYSEIFYERIKNEETKDIFRRLENAPEDILNLFEKLATRKIGFEYFEKLKKLHEKAPDDDKISYLTLVSQHFPLKVFLDDVLWSEFIKMPFPWFFEIDKTQFIVEITHYYVENMKKQNDSYHEKYLQFIEAIKRRNLSEKFNQILVEKFKEHAENLKIADS